MHVNVIQKQRREFLGNNIYMCPLYKVVRDGEKKTKNNTKWWGVKNSSIKKKFFFCNDYFKSVMFFLKDYSLMFFYIS